MGGIFLQPEFMGCLFFSLVAIIHSQAGYQKTIHTAGPEKYHPNAI
jgi:hypothetical protein